MYHNFYGLHQKPFHTTPDPEFLYLSPSHKQALGSIIYGIEEKKGFIAVTGEVGLGKTTILRSYLAQVDSDREKIIYLLNPNLSFIDLLRAVLCELTQDLVGSDESKLVSRLHEALIEQYGKGRPVLLIIDEAQNMPVATLESLRMLSNLETSKDKLIQIVLVGQPELDDLLKRHELRQLNQRIAVRATLLPLSKKDSYAYIRHRLAKAGAKQKKVFTGRALSLIVREAKGNPRQLNIICDNALVTGLGYKKKPVTAGIAKEVIADLNGPVHRFAWKWIPFAASIAICFLAVAWIVSQESQGFWHAAPVTKLKGLIAQGTVMTKAQLNLHEESEQLKRNDIAPTATQDELPARDLQTDNAADTIQPDLNTPIAVSTVREGDTLEMLARKVYGMATPKHMQQILDANPHITDSKRIFPGQIVTFPKIADSRASNHPEDHSFLKE